MSEGFEVEGRRWTELSQIAEMVGAQQDSGIVYLLLERVGEQLRLLNENGGGTADDLELIHQALRDLELGPARRVGNLLMREMVMFFAPAVEDNEVSRNRFLEARNQFERMVHVWMGLSRWNSLMEQVYCVRGGPLFYEIRLIMKAMVYESAQIDNAIQQHPSLSQSGTVLRLEIRLPESSATTL